MLHYFIRSLFCHTTINGNFNSRNYILTKICSELYNKINRTYFRKKGAYIFMERRENDERTERSKNKLEELIRRAGNIKVEENLDMALGMIKGIEEEEKKQGI